MYDVVSSNGEIEATDLCSRTAVDIPSRPLNLGPY